MAGARPARDMGRDITRRAGTKPKMSPPKAVVKMTMPPVKTPVKMAPPTPPTPRTPRGRGPVAHPVRPPVRRGPR